MITEEVGALGAIILSRKDLGHLQDWEEASATAACGVS